MPTTTEGKFRKQYVFQEDSFFHLGVLFKYFNASPWFPVPFVPIENIFLYILLVFSGYKSGSESISRSVVS